MEFDFVADKNQCMKISAAMWRLCVQDRQVASHSIDSKGCEFKPILAPKFHNLISNPRIEEIFSSLGEDTDMVKKQQMLKEKLSADKLSQFTFLLELKKDEEMNIELMLSEFKVIFAAKTFTSLTKTLKHINHITNTVLPKVILAKAKEAPEKMRVALKNAAAQSEKALGKDSKLSLKCNLSNLIFLLPESVLTKCIFHREEKKMS